MLAVDSLLELVGATQESNPTAAAVYQVESGLMGKGCVVDGDGGKVDISHPVEQDKGYMVFLQ